MSFIYDPKCVYLELLLDPGHVFGIGFALMRAGAGLLGELVVSRCNLWALSSLLVDGLLISMCEILELYSETGASTRSR